MTMKHLLAAAVLLAAPLASVPKAGANDDDLATMVGAAWNDLFALYRHLHSHPELSFHEKATAARLSAELESYGFEVIRGIGGHGLAGVLRNGTGPTLMLRTDMDALPLTEDTALPFASRVRIEDDAGQEVGVMHACGHDVHMTVFAGTARLLARTRDRWAGTLVVIGQPAEERGAGARAMLKDGLLDRIPRPDFALALHCSSSVPAGSVGFCEGHALANVDMVDLVIYGEGGHGAYPHRTKDPIAMAAEVVMSLQTIVSREIKPLEPAVVTVGSIHGGTKHNIIPSEVKLELTCRSYSDGVRRQILEAIERKAAAVARGAGMPDERLPVMTVRNESIPSTWNDPELTKRVAGVARRALGGDHVLTTEPVMGGEDFGIYGRVEPRIPICIFWLGAVPPARIEESRRTGKPLPSLHSPFFAPDPEPTIKTGVRTMTAAAWELLARR